MLREIRIQNLGVIDDAVLALSPGLNVVTGETGAGKTMVVSGLGLLLGARADAGLVRNGATAASIEGLVEVPEGHPALVRAQEAGGDTEDGLILARTVSAEGRSRAHVGGRSAPVGVLSDLRELLVAVHGQSDQWRLRQPDQHRVVLDGFAGASVAEPLARYTALYDEHHQLRTELDELRALARDRAREIDVLTAGVEEVEAVDPQPGEDHELRAEDERLAHAEGLRGSAGLAHALVAGATGGPEEEAADEARGNVVELLAETRATLGAASVHDPALADLERRAQELGYLAADLGADLAAYLSHVDFDPARLAWVQERRADLARLQRKYGDTVDEVLAWAKEAAARLDRLVTADDRAEAMQARLEQLEAELTAAAANPGAPPRSVAKAASGGELSRVMLALEVVTGSGDVPTFVFDEVDAGVGGKAALDVGARLAALAGHAQVIVVTHLAQVAAFADQHLVVRKTDDGHVTASGVVAVTGEERLRELARMMAGTPDSEIAVEHARELMEQARPRRR